MKPNRKAPPPNVMETKAAELSGMFAEAQWRPSQENFSERPFVTAHPFGFVVAGFPPNQGCRSKACQTEQAVIDFLNECMAEPAPVVIEPVPEPEPPAEACPDPRDVALEAANARIAQLEAAASTLISTTSQTIEGLSSRSNGEGDVSSVEDLEAPVPEGVRAIMDEPDPSPEQDRADLDDLLARAEGQTNDELEAAVAAIPAVTRKRWTEMLHGEKADLRTKRDTDQENLPREKQIDRMTNLFARVGEKR